MEGWNYWNGKSVFIRTKSNRVYSGKVLEIEKSENLVWVTILDKFDKRVRFVNSEIVEIKEEVEDGD
jgi:small nuclear ribonucleoprotein (snRNP)-like protein